MAITASLCVPVRSKSNTLRGKMKCDWLIYLNVRNLEYESLEQKYEIRLKIVTLYFFLLFNIYNIINASKNQQSKYW